MNRKKSIIIVMVISVMASSLYGAWELRHPSAYISGTGQLQNWTYEEMVKIYPIVIHGVITDVQLDHITIDEHGHVADPNTMPI